MFVLEEEILPLKEETFVPGGASFPLKEETCGLGAENFPLQKEMFGLRVRNSTILFFRPVTAAYK